eukprot:CAMPEP_0182916792 /NCGR_PEP_ID=MMETSP0105_2-20130417/1148_1 /TAXON_ID=81532 ORGANISM="Acanthoeca-like sp., Strain 10tr" /NCGR_SAMPLE_ID=MMETSP0105_2 /ASSEMBLY_ACC=CAM_ASM_000205 /LENGTH=246 /DNA_ID=CAMNT_0025053759 /DNA_START=13 /DNA_END=753 /DNA_ORIENTATION=+
MADKKEEGEKVEAPAPATTPVKKFTFKTPKLSGTSSRSPEKAAVGTGGAGAAADADPEAEVDIKFAPLVKLAPVKVSTGEEDEDILLEVRAKMFFWGQGNAGLQWKERGVGALKLLKHKETGMVRLLMRRDQTLKICANHLLSKEMVLESKQGSDRSWVYTCYADFSDGEAKQVTCAVRFKNKEIADQFAAAFNEARDANSKLAASTPHDPAGDPAVDEIAAGVEKVGIKDGDVEEAAGGDAEKVE